MNKKYLLLILPLAIIVGGLLYWMRHKPITIHPQRRDITEAVYASGYIVSRDEYKVYALTDGVVSAKYRVTGDSVAMNSPVYAIKSDGPAAKRSANEWALKLAETNTREDAPVLLDLQIKIKNAETLLANDQLNYNRYTNMYAANAIAKTQLDQATTNLEVSKNNLKSALESYSKMRDQLTLERKNAAAQLATTDQDLSNYTMKSLIDGMVYETYKEVGEGVRKNDPLALIGRRGGKYLQLSVDQQDIDRIQIGQVVMVKMDVESGKVYRAHVSKIYPNMNQSDQSFRVDAAFEQDGQIGFIHASVEANIVIAEKKNAVVLPLSAFLERNKVNVLRQGKSETVTVTRGLENMDGVEVLTGVSTQDEVITPK